MGSDVPPKPPDHRPSVLVVDDDQDARSIYATYLQSKGCEVFTAPDGRRAIQKAQDLWPDIILMDLAMPRLDGWEAIRQLRESSWTRAIPIIAISAVPMSEESALQAGSDAYLEKPCDLGALWLQICALMDGAGAQSSRR
jgi:CheY-like chemotaxis protein